MQGRIVRTFTSDNLNLQGMLCVPSKPADKGRVVLHIHGSYGNFYENLFLDAMAEAYTSTGTAFLSVNTRGHDYYADFKMKRPEGGYDSKRIGGILERFEESRQDIRAWIDFSAREGLGAVILQGHSLGAMKAAFYCSGVERLRTQRRHGEPGPESAVTALFLVSPPDLLGSNIEMAKARIEPNLMLARKLSAGNPDALMPEGSHFDPIGAAAYISLYSDLNVAGMFSFPDEGTPGNPILASIRAPVHAIIGEKDEYICRPAQEGFRRLGKALGAAPVFAGKVVPGANHVFDDAEDETASALADWVLEAFAGTEREQPAPA